MEAPGIPASPATCLIPSALALHNFPEAPGVQSSSEGGSRLRTSEPGEIIYYVKPARKLYWPVDHLLYQASWPDRPPSRIALPDTMAALFLRTRAVAATDAAELA